MRLRGWAIGALALFGAMVFALRGYFIDDTFIHLQYAKHLRAGLGLVFNPGEAVAGSTSPAWSALLGVIPLFGADLLGASRALSVVFGGASLVLFAGVAGRLIGRRPEAAAAVVAWGANAWMARWSPTGMETSLAVLLVLAGLLVGLSGEGLLSAARRASVAGLWTLAALVRPEASLLVLLALGFLFLAGSGTAEGRRLGARLAHVAPAALAVLAVFTPYAVYALSTYGTLLPGTLAAKSAAGTGLGISLVRLSQSAQIVLAVAGVEVIFLVLLTPRLRGLLAERGAPLHLAVLAWCVGVPLAFAARGLPVLSRYLLPLLPIVVLYGWRALAGWRSAHPGSASRLLLGVAVVVAVGTNALIFASRVLPHARAFTDGMHATLIPWGKWLRENTPADALVATPDIGAIGYYSDRRVLDLGGLVSPGIVPLMREMPYDELVRSFAFRSAGRPDFLVDRGRRPRRLLDESPAGPALTALFTARTQSLGVAQAGAVDYTLYRVDWEVVNRLLSGEQVAVRWGSPSGDEVEVLALDAPERP
jgi:hypothetical protein